MQHFILLFFLCFPKHFLLLQILELFCLLFQKGLFRLLLGSLTLLGADLSGLSLESLGLLVLDPKGFFTGLVHAEHLEPHELDFHDGLHADLLHMLGVVSAEHQ